MSECDHDVGFGIREKIARCGFPHRSMRAVIAFSVGTVLRCVSVGSRLSLQLRWFMHVAFQVEKIASADGQRRRV